MTRTVFVRTPCGCSSPGIAAALDREVFDKAAAQQLSKGRRQPQLTPVAVYVKRKQAGVTRKLAKYLRSLRAPAKKKLLALYAPPAEKLAKAEKKPPTNEEIIAALNSLWIADDLDGYITPALIAAYHRGMDNGFTQVGFDLGEATEQIDTAAVAYAEARGGELITDLSGTTADDMQALLARAVDQGMSTDELATAIDDSGAFGEYRANMIARTELAFAHVAGNVQGWRDSGEVSGKRSILGDLHDVPDVCDDCADIGEVGLDDEFVDGFEFPPYHPHCVCDVVPILRESDDTTASDDASTSQESP
jgi:hypothetical protein